jgi:uncharacterized membrane protein YcjF (UPF0283 family)
MPGPFRGALRGLMPNGGGSTMGSIMDQTNWIYLAATAILLVIVIALVVLTIREYYLLKHKKK